MRGRLILGQTILRLISRTYIDVAYRPNLVLYTSDECSLCVHFKKHLEHFLVKNNLDLEIEYRDIKQCDQLTFEQYKHSIPVLTSEGKVVCQHRFSRVGFNMPGEVDIWCADALKQTADDVTIAVSSLENHKYFNCGVGSNLTAQGTVECEAGYMTSKYFKFGAVGCVSTVKNPILAARAVALDIPTPGLAKPQVLVGKGAEQWARERKLEMCEPEDLITSNAQSEWRETTQNLVECSPLMLSDLSKLDTVGGVAIKDGHAEACVSSGGILYKRPGRLGQCTFFGSGIWADKSGDTLIAVSASGLGEALVRTDFCRSLSRAVMNRNSQDLPAPAIEHWFQNEFLRSPYLTDIPSQMILAGGIVLLQEGGCSELLVFHNTPSFPVAFKSRGKVKRKVSKMDPKFPVTVKVESYLL